MRERCHLAPRCENSKHANTSTVGFCAYVEWAPRVFSVQNSSILCRGWKVSCFLLGTNACKRGVCLTSVKIHTHKLGDEPKDFSALPNFTKVNTAADDRSEADYIVVLLRKWIFSRS